MTTSALLAAAALACLPPAGSVHQWIRTVDRQGGFAVKLPCAPRRGARMFPGPRGPVPAHFLWARAPSGGNVYLVIYEDLPEEVRGCPAPVIFESVVRSSIRSTHGRLLGTKRLSLYGHPARLYTIRTPDGFLFVSRLMFLGQRVLQISVELPPHGGDSHAVDRFFSSLTLLAEG